ncbi:MAG: hypothetical protein KUG77_15095 [Nannocystaceae bacterium]|nr:hypothetical protein [Nannocystaceae bacterium]
MPMPHLLLAVTYGAIAAAMVMIALVVAPTMFCFARGRALLRRRSSSRRPLKL